MNFLGKIFVVLNLVLSVFLMSAAILVYGAHRNWKVDSEKKSVELTKVTNDKNALADQLSVATKALNAVKAEDRQALARSESALAQKVSELHDQRKANTELEQKQRSTQEQLDVAVASLNKAQAEVTQLRGQVPQILAKRDEAFTTTVAATEKFNASQGDVQRLEERNKSLVIDLAAARLLLEKVGIPLGTSPDLQAPPVDGEITNVSGDTLVEISLGSDDGIRAGHPIVIFRENKFLARAEIIRTTPNRAVAQIVKETRTAPVQQGDRMTTKVKG